MFQKREYKEAVGCYQQALEMDPRNAAAHLELGLLYEDKLQDYGYAIYHYRRYLELRPKAEKADLVKQFVDRSQLALAASLTNTPVEAGEEIARLRRENSTLLSRVESLTQTNEVLEQRLVRLSRSPEEITPPPILVTNVFVLPPVTNAPPPVRPPANSTTATVQHTASPPTVAEGAKAKTYTVVRGDTLSTISLKMYGRRDKWQLIYSSNESVIGPPPAYKLKIGQTLTIPKI